MNRKKKHHYLPISYLNGFCDQKNMIWTYHKDLSAEPHCQKPENTAFIKNFYAMEREDGSLDTNTFEDALSDIIEGPAANALNSLRFSQIPSFDDQQQLALFIGFMLARTPSYRKFYEEQHNKEYELQLKFIATSKERFLKWSDEYKKLNNEPLANDIEELRQEILNDEYKIQVHPNLRLYIMQKISLSTSFILADMKWIIEKSGNNIHFITSDNPIIVTNPNYQGGYYTPSLLTEGTEIYIPISKDINLLMIKSEEEVLDIQINVVNKEVIKKRNRAIVSTASRFIYSPEKNDKIIRMIKNANNKLRAMQTQDSKRK